MRERMAGWLADSGFVAAAYHVCSRMVDSIATATSTATATATFCETAFSLPGCYFLAEQQTRDQTSSVTKGLYKKEGKKDNE